MATKPTKSERLDAQQKELDRLAIIEETARADFLEAVIEQGDAANRLQEIWEEPEDDDTVEEE